MRREKSRAGKQPSHGQTATRAPRETVRVPSSVRPGSVRVLLLARTLREHLPEDQPTDSCRVTCATLLCSTDHPIPSTCSFHRPSLTKIILLPTAYNRIQRYFPVIEESSDWKEC